MRKAIIFPCMVLLLSGLAAAQANGQASVVSGYATTGVYSMPIVPLVTTPSLTLGAASLPLADNTTTADNGGGATYVSSHAEDFDFGAARSQASYGAAVLASLHHPGKAAKIYTNQDVAQVNDTNGLVKFGNKTEHL